jgi:hypothetical protein
LGYAIDAMFPDELGPAPHAPSARAPDGPLAPSTATSPSAVSSSGPSSFTSGDPAGVHIPSPPGTSRDVDAGSPPLRRRRL